MPCPRAGDPLPGQAFGKLPFGQWSLAGQRPLGGPPGQVGRLAG